ncbi:MAG: hypothetical protein RIQ89_708 [Bacteroidota bacterium]
MKKVILTIALAATAMFANAQTMTSKNGTMILPEADNWWIGVDAAPALNYFGNLLNNSSSNSVGFSYQKPLTIVGGMVVDANTSYRVQVGIGFGSSTVNALIDQDGSTSNPPAQVTDTYKDGGSNITIGGGLQKNRGKGRLRGIYGVEAGISLGSSKDTYTYGNAINSTYPNPGTTNFGGNIGGIGRIKESKAGSTFGFGVRGFIGAEYFFAAKMSIGGEFGWGPSLSSTGEGEVTSEGWDAQANGVKTLTTKTGKSSSFGLGVDNASGQIVMRFYF